MQSEEVGCGECAVPLPQLATPQLASGELSSRCRDGGAKVIMFSNVNGSSVNGGVCGEFEVEISTGLDAEGLGLKVWVARCAELE